MAHGLEIKRARYSPAMHLQQTQFFHLNHIAKFAPTTVVLCKQASTTEPAASG